MWEFMEIFVGDTVRGMGRPLRQTKRKTRREQQCASRSV